MTEVNRKKTDEAWKRLYARLEADELLPCAGDDKQAEKRRLLPARWTRTAGWAAVLAGVCGCVLWWLVAQGDGSRQEMVTQENKEQATLVKTLEDGTVVYLAQASTLQYPEHFAADSRRVNLHGEAFFDIARKPQQRFLIETARVRVEVLGTAFDVRSKEDEEFSLAVRRGRVRVVLKEGGQSVLAEAGETVTLQGNRLALSAAESGGRFERYLRSIRFKDECLEDVLRVINKESAGRQIEVNPVSLGKRRLTVEFSDTSPETVAELIGWTFGLKCTHRGNRLVLSE